jgi:hypothetical protein
MTYKRKYPKGEYDPRAPRPERRGPRPQAWVTGPDPVEHKKYRAYIQHRNQSNYRDEPWDITFEQYKQIWAERWDQRGRDKHSYCMTRKDYSEPWTLDNVMIVTRREHNLNQINQVGRNRRGEFGGDQ